MSAYPLELSNANIDLIRQQLYDRRRNPPGNPHAKKHDALRVN
jgi:hypothetical protein